MTKPTRRQIHAKQQELERREELCDLRFYLPESEHARDWVLLTEDRRLLRPSPLPSPDDRKKAEYAPDKSGIFYAMQRRAEQAGAAAIFQAEGKARADFAEIVERVREGIENGNLDPLVQNLALYGFSLFADSAVRKVVQTWWRQAKAGQRDGAKNLKVILKALGVGSGRQSDQHDEEKRAAVVNDCKKWRPICEGLNKVFK